MTRLNTPTSGYDQAAADQNGSPPPPGADDGRATCDSSHAAGETAEQPHDSRSGIDRAEEIADNLAHQVGVASATLTKKLVAATSRAREALQDFWAEVQAVRRGERP
jgi:hypothetical protein